MRRMTVVALFFVFAAPLYTHAFRSGEVLSAFSGSHVLHENGFAAARILTPPSESTNGQTEVLFANGVKTWVKHTLPSHKIRKGELQVGETVLWNGYFSSSHNELNYRFGAWYFGTVTEDAGLSGGTVEVNGIPVPLVWIRV